MCIFMYRQGSVIADCIVTVLKNYTKGAITLKTVLETETVNGNIVQNANITGKLVVIKMLSYFVRFSHM